MHLASISYISDDCVVAVSVEYGGATTWSNCKCPPECYKEAYAISATRGALPFKVHQLHLFAYCSVIKSQARFSFRTAETPLFALIRRSRRPASRSTWIRWRARSTWRKKRLRRVKYPSTYVQISFRVFRDGRDKYSRWSQFHHDNIQQHTNRNVRLRRFILFQFITLLSNLGGQLGFILGISVVGVIEVIVLCAELGKQQCASDNL